MRPRHAAVLLAAAALGGCFYDFKNPAEDLRRGEARGTTVADLTGTGVLAPAANVAVSLKGAAFDQLSRPDGRFFVLDLPVGTHRLLFRQGTAVTLERDVQLGYGADGQPEGIELGEVALRAAAAVEGAFALPAGITLAGGVAVDETSGQTAALVPGVAVPPSPAPPATFRFPALSVGTHVVKLAATDTLSGKWVGGQVTVNVGPADGGKTISLATVAARAASSSGHLRFRLQAVGLALSPTALQVYLAPDPMLMNPITPASDGSVDVSVPEGLYTITVVPPLTAPPLGRLEPGAPPVSLALAPVPTRAPPAAYGVVLDSRIAEVGSLYVSNDLSLLNSKTTCLVASNCGGLSCTAAVCMDYLPPTPPVAAGVSWCAPCTYSGSVNAPGLGGPCQAGPNVPGACACPGGKGVDCIASAIPPVTGYCTPQACGFNCTPDGSFTTVYNPPTGACP